MFRIAMQMFSLRVAPHYEIQNGIKLNFLMNATWVKKTHTHAHTCTHIYTKQMRTKNE